MLSFAAIALGLAAGRLARRAGARPPPRADGGSPRSRAGDRRAGPGPRTARGRGGGRGARSRSSGPRICSTSWTAATASPRRPRCAASPHARRRPRAPGASPGVFFALAGAILPFLAVNAPPARMFMGDVGSVPLGFLAGTFGIAGVWLGTWPGWFPLLVFLPLVADATVTLRAATASRRAHQRAASLALLPAVQPAGCRPPRYSGTLRHAVAGDGRHGARGACPPPGVRVGDSFRMDRAAGGHVRRH